MTSEQLTTALQHAVAALRARDRKFALVGGLAVSMLGEVRFTRDVDLAVAVDDDTDAEELVRLLRADGYVPFATVEHEDLDRLSTVRLRSPHGIKVDLLFASCGIEAEIVARAQFIEVGHVGRLPVARVEELLAMKVLSMTDRRLQDRIDARALLTATAGVDLERVQRNLRLMKQRGYHRGEDLDAKLRAVIADTTG